MELQEICISEFCFLLDLRLIHYYAYDDFRTRPFSFVDVIFLIILDISIEQLPFLLRNMMLNLCFYY